MNMCGFAGINFLNKKLIESMGQTLKSRIKDKEYYYYYDDISLYHAHMKLSDIRLNTNQPFLYKNLIILLVGEIYNKEYLLNLIGLSGEQEYTELEIIGLLYEYFGETFIDYINGEFAIFILNRETSTYLLFRDRYGVHSIYYKIIEDKLFFSSELKSLILKKNDIKINKNAFYEYSIFGFSISPNTIINNINILKPGYYLKFTGFNYKLIKFGQYLFQNNYNTFIETLENSIIRRIPKYKKRIFIPISGGIDSNLVLYFLYKHFKGKIIAYTFYNNNNLEDVNVAIRNIKKYKLKHLLINIDNIKKNSIIESIYTHEGLVKLINTGKLIRKNFSEYSDINIEFSGDGREELFFNNNHFNYKKIYLRYHFFLKKGYVDKYNIDNKFLNLKMFDYNLQLIEKLSLNNLIERRLPFTDYELLRFKNYKFYQEDAKKFLNDNNIDIVKGIYGHNNGIFFKYIEGEDLINYLKLFLLKLKLKLKEKGKY